MINICIIATIVIYLVGMLLVGFVYSKSNEDSSDFYLGGRTMGPLVTAMSAEASDMSSWLLMGMPGLAYLTGIASPGWTAIGLAVGTCSVSSMRHASIKSIPTMPWNVPTRNSSAALTIWRNIPLKKGKT